MTVTLTRRATKGSPLTAAEFDGNMDAIAAALDDKLEQGDVDARVPEASFSLAGIVPNTKPRKGRARAAARLSPRDFGAIGDDTARTVAAGGYATSDFPDVPGLLSTDQLDYAAIVQAQAALVARGGGELDYEDGAYVLNKFINMASRVHHRGRGQSATRLRNLRTHSNIYHRYGFLPGVLHPNACKPSNPSANLYLAYPCADVPAWSDRVTLSTHANAATSLIGKFCSPSSTAGEEPADQTFRLPDQMEGWPRISDANPSTGVVVFDRPVPRGIAGAILYVVAGIEPYTGLAYQMIEDCSVRGMTIDADGPFAIGGARGFVAEDIDCVGAQSLIILNSMVKATFRRVRGSWSNLEIELKHGCDEVLVEDSGGPYRYDPALLALLPDNHPTAQPVAVGEGSGRIDFVRVRAFAGRDYPSDENALVDLSNCHTVRFTDCEMITLAPAMPYLAWMRGGARQSLCPDGVTIEGGVWHIGNGGADGCSYGILLGYPSLTGQPRNVHINRAKITGALKTGAPAVNAITVTGGTGGTIRGNTLPTGYSVANAGASITVDANPGVN